MSELRGRSVLVAMSGGVDSAVAALLLCQAGLRAVGLTMKNYCYGQTDVPERSCCSVEAIQDARRECDRLGMAHRVADVEDFFTREVIDDFVSEYENARTPNPCVRCNSIVRFQTLIDYADKLGMDYVATGHYARVLDIDGRRYLARSSNREKDQTYFLSGVHGETLERVLFPLGDHDKSTVRKVAESASMAVAQKSESQEVCFVPEGTLRSFLESRKVRFDSGPIETVGGDNVGSHDGMSAYTIGQRRRLGVATGTPQYVVRLDPDRNAVVIGDRDSLLGRELSCRFSWLDAVAAQRPNRLSAQIRYRHAGAPIKRLEIDGMSGRIVFAEPQRAICPGQTVALYDNDVVVGSGVIDGAG